MTAADAWFDLVPLGLLEFDAQGMVLRSNPALAQVLGYRVAVGSSLAEHTPDLQHLCGWDAQAALSGLQCQGPPLRAQKKKLGSQVHVMASMDADVSQRRYLCTIQNEATATAQNKPTDTLPPVKAPSESEQAQLLYELSTILESTPTGIAYLRNGILIRCNRQFERMMGVAAGTLAGQNLTMLASINPKITEIRAQAKAALQDHGQFETELEAPPSDQGTRWFTLSLRRLGATLDPPEIIVVLTDVTRSHLQQAQLEALGRDRDLMFSLSGVGIAFVRDGLIQSANPALSHLLGDAQLNLTGRPLHSLYANAIETQAEPEVLRVLRSLGHWQGQRALKHPRGIALWTEVALRQVNPSDPQAGYIASFVNVDDRHRAEQSLTLQADRTRAILDSVFVGIVTLDTHGIAWMNRSARRMFGGDLADFVGQPLSTVATSDLDHPFRLTDYIDHLQDGQSHTFECQVVGRDGRVFWVVGNAVVTFGGRNQRQITYALLDIDRRRQAEAQSEEAQATLQRIIEMAPMAIHLIDAHELTLLQANQAASAYILVDPATALGKTPEQLYDADRARLLRSDMQNSLDSGQSIHREYSVGAKGTSQIWDVNYLPLARDSSAAEQLLVVASDISEQRAAEKARLDAAIAQREMLVKEVHHRIKNNLQGVAGLLQQIAARKPEVASAISEVVGQVQAIAQVYGLQVGAGGPLSLHSVIEAIALSVQRTFGRHITLSLVGPQAQAWLLPEVESIPIALSLNELLTNAHKHGPSSEPLLCTLVATETGVLLDIVNPGRLPAGFSIDLVRGGVAGLGLVRALLPRRSAKLTMTQVGPSVQTRIELKPPAITLAVTQPVVEQPSGQQIALWPQ